MPIGSTIELGNPCKSDELASQNGSNFTLAGLTLSRHQSGTFSGANSFQRTADGGGWRVECLSFIGNSSASLGGNSASGISTESSTATANFTITSSLTWSGTSNGCFSLASYEAGCFVQANFNLGGRQLIHCTLHPSPATKSAKVLVG